MNKNYIFVGLGIAVVVIILAIILSQNSTVSQMTLDEIIKNKDCKALQEWELDHSFDESLDITSKQMNDGVQLAMECTGRILDNMMGTSSSSQPDKLDIEIITDDIVNTPTTTIQNKYEIQITIDKQQYRVGERIQVDVTISPDWYGGIILGVDDSSDTFNGFDIDQDNKYDTTIKISKFWDIGMHNVNLRNNPYASLGYVSPIVEFEIIE